MENIKFFTFPNGRETVLFRSESGNNLMFVDAKTHKVIAKKNICQMVLLCVKH